MEMIRETVGLRRRMLSLLQVAREGCGSGSGSDSDKVDSKRSRAIDKSRRVKISRDIENVLKRNSGVRTLQVQGRG